MLQRTIIVENEIFCPPYAPKPRNVSVDAFTLESLRSEHVRHCRVANLVYIVCGEAIESYKFDDDNAAANDDAWTPSSDGYRLHYLRA